MKDENLEKAKKLMDQGWRLREELKFEEADKLLIEARKLFEEEGDWFNVTEAINHLAYSEKIKAGILNSKGLSLSEESLQIAKKHNLKQAFSLRAAISLASSAGNFELALKYCKAALVYFEKPLPRADILSHMAVFLLRTGKLEEAVKVIDDAIKLCDDNWETEGEPHRSIWKSKILLTKGLVLYNQNNVTEAKKWINAGYEIAKEKDLKTRIKEAEALLQLFDPTV